MSGPRLLSTLPERLRCIDADVGGVLRALLSSIPSQLAVLDASGTILLTNAAWTAYAGPPGSLAERPAEGENYLHRLEAVGAPDRDAALRLRDAAAEILAGTPEHFDLEVTTRGSAEPCVLLATLARFDLADGPRLTLSYRDVTTTYRVLRESEERFKFAVEGSGGAFWDWDVKGSIVTRSGQLPGMLGLPRLSSNPAALRERIHPDDVARTCRRFADLLQAGADTCAVEHRVRHEDGSWRWIMTRCAVMKRDEASRPLRVLGVHTDITDLKEAEASLRDHRNRNRLLAKVAAHTTNAVIITDAQRRIVWTNRSFTTITGYTLEDAQGKSPGALLQGSGTDAETVEEIRAELARATPVRKRILNYRKDGSPFWLNLEIQPILTAEQTVESFVAIMEDLTERERLEAELRLSQKLESVGQLAAGIAHEINTPIQFVGDSVTFLEEAWRDIEPLLGQAQAARSAGAPTACDRMSASEIGFLVENFPGAISRARHGVQRVANLVRAMKEFAHPDQGEYSSADINRAIESALAVSRNEIKYVGTAATDLGEIPLVPCRIGSINQVLLNLIVNAAHALADRGHTPQTGRIEVGTRVESEHVVIRIRDNGCGIPEAVRERIFDPFFTTKEVGRGTGQGLAITRSIVVEQHGGKIAVESQPGEGSCFEVWLPLTQPQQPDLVQADP